ncbi:MAG: hypothetical protein LH650_09410, partial [Chloroflexi bacterium]|nr:hypothetical protein [Chloroflexota bacterium]
MVRRPYQQATRPDQGRQRSPRSRSFAAGAVTLATLMVVVVGLVLAPRSDERILGADRSPTPTAPVVSEAFRELAHSLIASVLGVPPPVDQSAQSGSTDFQIAIGRGAPPTSTSAPDDSPDTSASAPASPTAAAQALASPGLSLAPSPAPSTSTATGGKPIAAQPTSAEPEDLTGYTWPLYQGRMTNFFGPRDNGFLVVDGQRLHAGLDTTTFCGDQVRV